MYVHLSECHMITIGPILRYVTCRGLGHSFPSIPFNSRHFPPLSPMVTLLSKPFSPPITLHAIHTALRKFIFTPFIVHFSFLLSPVLCVNVVQFLIHNLSYIAALLAELHTKEKLKFNKKTKF